MRLLIALKAFLLYNKSIKEMEDMIMLVVTTQTIRGKDFEELGLV